MGLPSRKVDKQARKLGASYSFLFMQANGAQLRELATLDDAGHLRPIIDKTFPFDQTLDAVAYAEQGRANGKVVITLDDNRERRPPPVTSNVAEDRAATPTYRRRRCQVDRRHEPALKIHADGNAIRAPHRARPAHVEHRRGGRGPSAAGERIR